ncbi:MAG: LamG domain-containing protein [Nanoarchaeota archaeon]|nr:LamG domain-containing protein [Nanoarchaeota archaeon]
MTKKGRKSGPYYYDSIRLPDGKIKSVYLGSDMKKAKKKLSLLNEERNKSVKKRSSATLSKAMNGESYLLRTNVKNGDVLHKDRIFFYSVLFLMMLAIVVSDDSTFGYIGTGLTVNGLRDISYLDITGSAVKPEILTGNVILFGDAEEKYPHFVNFRINESENYNLSFNGIERLTGFKISGRVASEEGGVVKLFLSDVNSGDTFLAFDSDNLGNGIFNFLSGFAVNDISGIPAERAKYNKSYGGFAIIDSLGYRVDYKLIEDLGEGFRISLPKSIVREVNLTGNYDGWIAYEEYDTFGALEPENITFLRIFGFDFGGKNVTNYTNLAFTASSEGEELYGCNFWDFELGICLSEWEFLFDVNRTNYTAYVMNEVVAFAEGIFDPNKTDVEKIEKPEEPITIERDAFLDMISAINMSNYTVKSFESECKNACHIREILGSEFVLKFFVKDAAIEILGIETSVVSDEYDNTTYSFVILDDNGMNILGKPASDIITDSLPIISKTISRKDKNVEFEEEVVQQQVVINQPVKWKKTVILNQTTSGIEVDLPKTAENITLKKIINDAPEDVDSAKLLIDGEMYENLDEMPAKKTADFLGNTKLTGMAVGTANVPMETNIPAEEIKTILIEDLVDKIEVEYETPGPTADFRDTSYGKQVVLSSDIQYQNVLSYAEIPELPKSSIGLYRVVRDENGSEARISHIYNARDNDGNGYIDMIEWIVPVLGNESDTYDIIIEITEAYHLDENYGYISDIYNETKGLDGIWSEKIFNKEYARVVFEKNLTDENDITFYARNQAGSNTKVDVYYSGSNELIASFPVITSEDYYTIFLTNLAGMRDTFDLKINNLDGDDNAYIEFDYIVDPFQSEPGGEKELTVQECYGKNSGSTGLANFIHPCNGTYPAACGTPPSGDLLSCDDGNTEQMQYRRAVAGFGGVLINVSNSTINDCQAVGDVFLCYEMWGDKAWPPDNGCFIAVDADGGSSGSIVTTTCPGTTVNPGVTCANVTSLETWTCNTFFGSTPVGAIAANEVRVIAPGAQPSLLNIDVFFFNVTYTRQNEPPGITLNGPVNGSNFTEVSGVNVLLNVTVVDSDADLMTVRIFGSNGTTGATINNDDLIYYNESIANNTNVTYTWNTPVLDADDSATGTLLLLHFDRNELYGENDTNVMNFADPTKNGTLEESGVINLTMGKLAGAYDGNAASTARVTFGDQDDWVGKKNITYVGWLNPRSTATTDGIMGKRSGGFPQTGFTIDKVNDNFRVTVNTASEIDNDAFFFAGKWVHFALVLNDTTMALYKNGILADTSVGYPNPTEHNVHFEVGNTHQTGGGHTVAFDGFIDEIAIYNRSLTADEVMDVFRLRGGEYNWFVNVTNSTTQGTDIDTTNVSLTYTFFVNRGPIVRSVSISDSANVTTILNCAYNVTDDLSNTIQSATVLFYNETTVFDTFTTGSFSSGEISSQSLSGPAFQRHFQNWSCGLMAEDFLSNGSQLNATPVNITSVDPGVPTLVSPEDGVLDTNRTPALIWKPNDTFQHLPAGNDAACISTPSNCVNTSDPDNDVVTYRINITDIKPGGSGSEFRLVNVIEDLTNCDQNGNGFLDSDDNCTYVLETGLISFFDNGNFYNWTVNATDAYNQSTAPNPYRYNLSIYVAIFMRNDTVQFVGLGVGETNSTMECKLTGFFTINPQCPVVFENIGNVYVDVNLTGPGKNLFDSAVYPHPKSVFNFTVRNDSLGADIPIYTQVSPPDSSLPANGTNYTILQDLTYVQPENPSIPKYVRFDVKVTVPSAELPGNKTMPLPFTAYYAGYDP